MQGKRFKLGGWLRMGAALVALHAGGALAAPPAAEVFFRPSDLVEAQLSPSGRLLAVTTRLKGQQRLGLAVVDLSPGGKSKHLAQFTDADVGGVEWQDDGRLLFSTSDLAEGSGLRETAWGLYGIDVESKKLRQYVRRRGGDSPSEGLLAELLPWNHMVAKVPHPQPDGPNEDVLMAEVAVDGSGLRVPLRLNTRNGVSRAVDFKLPPNCTGWISDSRAQPRVAFTRKKDVHAAYWRAPGSTEWVQLYEDTLLKAPYEIVGIDDVGGLYVADRRGPEGYRVLARYDFKTQAPETKPLIATPGFDFDGSLVVEPGGKLIGVRTTVDGETTVWFDPRMKAFQDAVDGRFPGRVNRISCRRCGQADMTALVRSYSDHEPGELWVHQASAAAGMPAWRAVSRVRSGLDPAQMASMDLQRIKARDGRDLPVWVTRPDAAKGPLPAVVLLHGGPWVRGNEWGWHPMAQYLASRGYLVIEPEFRGSTGYGEAHFTAGWKQWGQSMQDDVADALLWARKQGLASDQACIAGASYGGYSTLMGLVKHPELYRCGIAWLAVADLDLFLQGAFFVDDDLSDIGRKYTLPDMVGDAVKDAAMIAANSPVKQAARIKAPVLLAYGESDLRVPLAHGKRLRDAMKDAGNPPEWVSYAHEAHGFTKLENELDFAKRLEAFLAKHLSKP
jgi:dipeptidyl aminopeptidase/acylaminoacyl peptidase